MPNSIGIVSLDVFANTKPFDTMMRASADKANKAIHSAVNMPLGRITGEASEFQKSLAASNARVIAFGASAGGIYALKAAFDKLVSSTIEVEQQMTQINAIFQVGGQSIQAFSSKLFEAANATSTSFSDAANAATEFARQGLSVEETLKRTTAALMLSKLGNIAVESSLSSLTATINSFSKESLDSIDIVNRLTAVDANYAVSCGDLAEALKRVGSSANDANISFNQTISIITAAQQTTARGGSVIGNSLKSMFTRLARPKILDDLEAVGVATRDSNGKLLPMMETMKNLATTYDHLSNSQKSFVSETVGGVYQINILKAILKDLGSGMSVYDGAMKSAENSTGSATRRIDILNSTISSRLIRTMNELTRASSNIGENLFGGTMKGGLNGFESILNKIANLTDKTNTTEGSKAGQFAATATQGLTKGIGMALSGPGVQFIVLTLVKLFQRLLVFIADSTKELTGVNEKEKQRAAVNESIAGFLGQQRDLLLGVVDGTVSAASAAEKYLSFIGQARAEMEALSIIANAVGGLAAPHVKIKTQTASHGYIPNLTNSEIEGARKGGYIAGNVVGTTIHNGMERGQAIVNTNESISRVIYEGKPYDFVNPPAGSPAGNRHRQASIAKTGLDPYSLPNTPIRAEGSIPNVTSTRKNGVWGWRTINESSGSYVDFIDTPKGKNIQMGRIKSLKKGDGFGLFNSVAERSRISGKPLVSQGFNLQQERLKDVHKGEDNFSNLQRVFPQLRWRNIAALKTGGVAEVMTNSGPKKLKFSSLAELSEMVNEIPRGEFTSNLPFASIKKVVSHFAAGEIPNLPEILPTDILESLTQKGIKIRNMGARRLFNDPVTGAKKTEALGGVTFEDQNISVQDEKTGNIGPKLTRTYQTVDSLTNAPHDLIRGAIEQFGKEGQSDSLTAFLNAILRKTGWGKEKSESMSPQAINDWALRVIRSDLPRFKSVLSSSGGIEHLDLKTIASFIGKTKGAVINVPETPTEKQLVHPPKWAIASILDQFSSDFPQLVAMRHAKDLGQTKDYPSHMSKIEVAGQEYKFVTPIYGEKHFVAQRYQSDLEAYKKRNNLAEDIDPVLFNFHNSLGNEFEATLAGIAAKHGISKNLSNDPIDVPGYDEEISKRTNITHKVAGYGAKLTLTAAMGKDAPYAIYRALVGNPIKKDNPYEGPIAEVPRLVGVAKGGIQPFLPGKPTGILDADDYRSNVDTRISAFDALNIAMIGTKKPFKVNYGPMAMHKTSSSIKEAGGENFVRSIDDLNKYEQFIINKTNLANVKSKWMGLTFSAASKIETFWHPDRNKMIEWLTARARGTEAQEKVRRAIAHKHDQETWEKYRKNIEYLNKKFPDIISAHEYKNEEPQKSFADQPRIKIPLQTVPQSPLRLVPGASSGKIPNFAVDMVARMEKLKADHKHRAKYVEDTPDALKVLESDERWDILGSGAESLALKRKGLVFKMPFVGSVISKPPPEREQEHFKKKVNASLIAPEVFSKVGLSGLGVARVRQGMVAGVKGIVQRYAGPTLGEDQFGKKESDKVLNEKMMKYILSKRSSTLERKMERRGIVVGVDAASPYNFSVKNPKVFHRIAKNLEEKHPNLLNSLSNDDPKINQLIKAVGLTAIDLNGYNRGFVPNMARPSQLDVLRMREDEKNGPDFAYTGPFAAVSDKLGWNPRKKVSGQALGSRIKSLVSPKEWGMYEEAGADNYLSQPRTPRAFSSWMQKNTKGVKVKTLEVSHSALIPEDEQRIAQITHEVESMKDFRIHRKSGKIFIPQHIGPEGVTGGVWASGDEIYKNHRNEKVAKKLASLQEEYRKLNVVNSQDSATARYQQVNPKKLNKMPGAVDLLVTAEKDKSEAPLYSSIHFGESGDNILAHARAYMEEVKGQKVFHLFEVQSDWNAARRKSDKALTKFGFKTDEEAEEAIKEGTVAGNKLSMTNYKKVNRHPLLQNYEKMVLQAAIGHARKQGATAIAISDSNTSLMTQQHDQMATRVEPVVGKQVIQYNSGGYDMESDAKDQGLGHKTYKFANGEFAKISWGEGPGDREVVRLDSPGDNLQRNIDIAKEIVESGYGKGVSIPQEKGMKFHYDKLLPQLAEELTGSKPEMVNFGEHQNVRNKDNSLRPNLLLENPDGSLKTDITARMFQLPKEVKRMPLLGGAKGISFANGLVPNLGIGFLKGLFKTPEQKQSENEATIAYQKYQYDEEARATNRQAFYQQFGHLQGRSGADAWRVSKGNKEIANLLTQGDTQSPNFGGGDVFFSPWRPEAQYADLHNKSYIIKAAQDKLSRPNQNTGWKAQQFEVAQGGLKSNQVKTIQRYRRGKFGKELDFNKFSKKYHGIFHADGMVPNLAARIKGSEFSDTELTTRLYRAALAGKDYKDFYQNYEQMNPLKGEGRDLFNRIYSGISFKASDKKVFDKSIDIFQGLQKGETGISKHLKTLGAKKIRKMVLDRVLEGESPRGAKTKVYYKAVSGDQNAFPIDSNVLQAATQQTPKSGEVPSAAFRARLETIGKNIAQELGWEPRAVQSAIFASQTPFGADISHFQKGFDRLKNGMVQEMIPNLAELAFHGTRATKNFDIFRKGDVGFHVGTENAAEDRNKVIRINSSLEGQQGEARVLPLKVDIKNPLRLKDAGDWDNPSWINEQLPAEKHSDLEDTVKANLKKGYSTYRAFQPVRKVLRSSGYDGIVYKNTEEGNGEDSQIAFYPHQIKSLFNKNPNPNRRSMTASRGFVPNMSLFSEASMVMKGLGKFASGIKPQVVGQLLGGEGVVETIMPQVMEFLRNPTNVIKSEKDLDDASNLLNSLTKHPKIRELFARELADRVDPNSFSVKATVAQFQEKETISGKTDLIQNYAKYRLFGGQDSLATHLKRIIPYDRMLGRFKYKADEVLKEYHQNPDSSISFTPGSIDYYHAQRNAKAIINNEDVFEAERGYGAKKLDKNKYLGYTHLLGRFVGSHNKKKTRATYRDTWDVTLHPEDQENLTDYFKRLSDNAGRDVSKILKKSPAVDYAGNSADSLILRKIISKLKASNPVIFKGIVDLSTEAKLNRISAAALGKIPNLFQSPVEEALHAENKATGGFATLSRSKKLISSINPLGLAAIDKRSQGNADEAISQHMSLGQSLSKIKVMRSSGGSIPNLAVGEEGMFSSGVVSNSLLIALMQHGKSIDSASKAADRLKFMFSGLFSAGEQNSLSVKNSTREYERARAELAKTGKTTLNVLDINKQQALSNNGKVLTREFTDLKKMEKFDAFINRKPREEAEKYDKEKEESQKAFSQKALKLSWSIPLVGGMASKMAERFVSPTAGAGIEEFTQGLTTATQVMSAFPTTAGKLVGVGIAGAAVASTLNVLGTNLANIRNSFEASQSKFQRFSSQVQTITTALSTFDSMVGDSNVTIETLSREQRKYAETVGQMSSESGNSKLVSKLATSTSNAGRLGILQEEQVTRQREQDKLAHTVSLQEYQGGKSFKLPDWLGGGRAGNSLSYKNDKERNEIAQALRDISTDLIASVPSSAKDFSKGLSDASAKPNGEEQYEAYLNTPQKDSKQEEGRQEFLRNREEVRTKHGDKVFERVKREAFEQTRASAFASQNDKNPEVVKARIEILNANRKLNASNRQVNEAQRLFINQGAMQSNSLLDVKTLNTNKGFNKEMLGIKEKELALPLMRRTVGETSVKIYESNLGLQTINAGRKKRISETNVETSRKITGELGASFEDLIAREDQSKSTDMGVPVGQTSSPKLAESKASFLSALNAGLSDVMGKGDLSKFYNQQGKFQPELMKKSIAASAAASSTDGEMGQKISDFLGTGLGSTKLLEAISEHGVKLADINLDAKNAADQNSNELKAAIKEINFKKLEGFMGGMKDFLDRGSRRTSLRQYKRAVYQWEKGSTAETRGIGAAGILDYYKERGVPINPEGTDDTSKMFKAALADVSTGMQEVFGKTSGMVMGGSSNSIAAKGFANYYTGTNRDEVIKAQTSARWQPELSKKELNTLTGGPDNGSKILITGFNDALDKSSIIVNTFSESLVGAASNFSAAINKFNADKESQGKNITDNTDKTAAALDKLSGNKNGADKDTAMERLAPKNEKGFSATSVLPMMGTAAGAIAMVAPMFLQMRTNKLLSKAIAANGQGAGAVLGAGTGAVPGAWTGGAVTGAAPGTGTLTTSQSLSTGNNKGAVIMPQGKQQGPIRVELPSNNRSIVLAPTGTGTVTGAVTGAAPKMPQGAIPGTGPRITLGAVEGAVARGTSFSQTVASQRAAAAATNGLVAPSAAAAATNGLVAPIVSAAPIALAQRQSAFRNPLSQGAYSGLAVMNLMQSAGNIGNAYQQDGGFGLMKEGIYAGLNFAGPAGIVASTAVRAVEPLIASGAEELGKLSFTPKMYESPENKNADKDKLARREILDSSDPNWAEKSRKKRLIGATQDRLIQGRDMVFEALHKDWTEIPEDETAKSKARSQVLNLQKKTKGISSFKDIDESTQEEIRGIWITENRDKGANWLKKNWGEEEQSKMTSRINDSSDERGGSKGIYKKLSEWNTRTFQNHPGLPSVPEPTRKDVKNLSDQEVENFIANQSGSGEEWFKKSLPPIPEAPKSAMILNTPKANDIKGPTDTQKTSDKEKTEIGMLIGEIHQFIKTINDNKKETSAIANVDRAVKGDFNFSISVSDSSTLSKDILPLFTALRSEVENMKNQLNSDFTLPSSVNRNVTQGALS